MEMPRPGESFDGYTINSSGVLPLTDERYGQRLVFEPRGYPPTDSEIEPWDGPLIRLIDGSYASGYDNVRAGREIGRVELNSDCAFRWRDGVMRMIELGLFDAGVPRRDREYRTVTLHDHQRPDYTSWATWFPRRASSHHQAARLRADHLANHYGERNRDGLVVTNSNYTGVMACQLSGDNGGTIHYYRWRQQERGTRVLLMPCDNPTPNIHPFRERF